MKPRESDLKTCFEIVLSQLRETIPCGELSPGGRIQEIAVGKWLGVPRTPVRNALTVLEREGMVRDGPNCGFTVRAFTTPEVLAAYEARSVLEGYACRLIGSVG